MKKPALLLLFAFLFSKCALSQQTLLHYLSGRDKDDTVHWEFFCTSGRNSNASTNIKVPSQWELQGFGTYAYGHDKEKGGEQGLYRHRFTAANNWKGKEIFLVFEGVMTDAEVKVNGTLAGPVHQGGFYRFAYNISPLLRYGAENLLEVTVSKQSANASVNRAERDGDFWALSGIYRPVYLKIVPQTYIDRVALDAKADGSLRMHVFTGNTQKGQTVQVQVTDLTGKPVGKPIIAPAGDSTYLAATFSGIQTWNPEAPRLYNAAISIRNGAATVHTITQRFGFRTAELRPHDGFYVNGVKVIFKGVNRHSAWPESGRTLSRDIHLMDIGLMKEMNMNAVRMSHYPPDEEFLDLCDSLGLFVLDELTGWQAAYDTTVGRKLVRELVQRDVNHPSVVAWANGNEGGWNRALDGDFHLYDPQRRLVYHPWEKFNGTDTKHYPDYQYVTNMALYDDAVYFPTEFMHGLYDGGHGAGLEDFWNRMLQHPHFAGGFLWSFSDEGVVRTDKDSIIDTHGNHAPDGIVGPHREKEGSFFTIKELWSPVVVHTATLPVKFDGKVLVENRYLYTNLDQCRFQWQLVRFPKATDNTTQHQVMQSGMSTIKLAPGEQGWLQLDLPQSITADALYLTAKDAKGQELFTWSWPLPAAKIALPVVSKTSNDVSVAEDAATLSLQVDGINYQFSKATGYLQKVVSGSKTFSLHDGPALAGVPHTLTGLKHYRQGNDYIVQPLYKADVSFQVQWTFTPGKLPRLQYSYGTKGTVDYQGITFQYPEEKVTGVKWLGSGPYRVWKNRLKGPRLGVWQKAYNNTVTGESWIYPEFKGWHANLQWVQLQTSEGAFTVYSENNRIFLGLFAPQKPAGAQNENTAPPFPQGIGFMHGISAIGTKFQPAAVMGPQSGKNQQLNAPASGVLWFDFR